MIAMKRALIILAVLLIAAITPFVPQFLDYVVVSMRKTGVVIDDETGKPMPNVIVIAAASHSSAGLLVVPGGTNPLYRVVTQTDSHGRFEIPASWSRFHLALPHQNPRYDWVITVFHVGYAVVGDRPDQELLHAGYSTYENPSLTDMPGHSFRFTHIEVDPIRMYKPTLGLKEAAIYYSRVRRTGGRSPNSKEPLDEAMRRQGYNLFAPWVCGLDPNMEIGSPPRGSILQFALDELKSIEKIAEQSVKEGFPHSEFAPSTKAGMVCAILTDGRNTP